jgi:putative membrane protein
MRKDIRNFLNGAVYGITLIIPGVSATIFAIILGFYDDLIYTLNHFREDYRKNTRYLLVFLLGIAAGAVALSSVILYLLANYSLPTMLFFMGLLLGIVPLIFLKAKGSGPRIAPRELVLAIISMFVLYAFSRVVTATALTPTEAINNMNMALVLYIFLAGIINGATLVIPGLSGAFILLVMGLYPLVIYSISLIAVFLGDMGNSSLLLDICIVLLPFGLGAVIGCLAMARLMEKLMRNFKKAVYAVILGLLLGSLITLLQDPVVYQSGTSNISIIAGLVMFCLGSAASYILGKRQ